MSVLKRPVESCVRSAVCLAWLLAAAAAGAAEPADKAGSVTVMDEACVDRRTEMCLRIAQGRGTRVLQSSLQEACSVLICRRGWHKWEIGQYGQLGPICECQRRSLIIGPGERCAEGFRESPAGDPERAPGQACELPDLTAELYPGGVTWPTTPFDLITCLQFARSGPGSHGCRRTLPASAN